MPIYSSFYANVYAIFMSSAPLKLANKKNAVCTSQKKEKVSERESETAE